MDTLELSSNDWGKLSFDLGDGVMLRRFRETDTEAIFETAKKNEEHLHFMHWITPDYSMQMAEEFLERSSLAAANGESLGFGIFRGEKFIGTVGFVYFDRQVRKTEIGYWLDADEEGKDIVSKATRALIDWAFGYGMNRIEIRCSTENVRSAAVPRRLGFTLEGHMRQSEFRHGRLVDFYVFGLLADEWKGKDQNS